MQPTEVHSFMTFTALQGHLCYFKLPLNLCLSAMSLPISNLAVKVILII